MASETLQDDLRRRTRNFTSALPEDEVFRLGSALARELVRAHAETPPRHPELDPAHITLDAGLPRLEGSGPSTDPSEDLFHLGALLSWLLTRELPDVSWRLDGPPAAELASVRRKAVLGALSSPRHTDRFHTAAEAVTALEKAQAPATEAPSGSGWPLFRGSTARDGVRTGATPARLASLWTRPLSPVIASPLVMGDIVVAVCGDGRVVFVDRENGRLLHELLLRSAVESSPAWSGAVLYVGTDDGALVTIDALAGREVSRVSVGQMLRASPLPVDDRVIVATVDAKGGAVVALGRNGKPAWTFRLGGPAFSSPTVVGHVLLQASDAGKVHALDPATGKEKWSIDLGSGKVRATPAAAGTAAVVGTFGGKVVSISTENGTTRWTRDLGHAIYSSASLGPKAITVGCHEGHLHGLDPQTGADRYTVVTRGPVVASPVACGEATLAASTDGALYLLGPDGAVLQTLALAPGGIQSSPALDGAFVAVGSSLGLHGVRLES
jgi:outer membrane protein assembly factor BamB